MSRAHTADPRVPVVMPAVEIRVDEAGAAQVSIDREPYGVPGGLRRDGVRRLVQDLADRLGPLRVTLIEANGESFVDIETPRTERSALAHEPRSNAADPVGRFQPGEEVLVTVVIARCPAGSDGKAPLRLPPAMLHRYGADIVLVGQRSNTVASLIDAEAEAGAEA
ncbi:hypothetical protein ACFWQC_03000 [Nocardioides sp. NPDC058538]|uniref:hypothetical protein n=1 Tax=Nocardioides sp. NPDC058538 TaxID=3346542 RepID=UPI003655EB94